MATPDELQLILKGAKIGAARSVVGTYSEVDARTPDAVQKEAPIPRQQSAGPALDRFAVDFCEWCNDFAEHPLICHKCHHKVCTARTSGHSGCVRSDTLPKGEQFFCPDCSDGRHHVSRSVVFFTLFFFLIVACIVLVECLQ
jgi:hypothetical protein